MASKSLPKSKKPMKCYQIRSWRSTMIRITIAGMETPTLKMMVNKSTALSQKRARPGLDTNTTLIEHTPVKILMITSTQITSRNSKKPAQTKITHISTKNKSKTSSRTGATLTLIRRKDELDLNPLGRSIRGKNNNSRKEPISTRLLRRGKWGIGSRPWEASLPPIMYSGTDITLSTQTWWTSRS